MKRVLSIILFTGAIASIFFFISTTSKKISDLNMKKNIIVEKELLKARPRDGRFSINLEKFIEKENKKISKENIKNHKKAKFDNTKNDIWKNNFAFYNRLRMEEKNKKKSWKENFAFFKNIDFKQKEKKLVLNKWYERKTKPLKNQSVKSLDWNKKISKITKYFVEYDRSSRFNPKHSKYSKKTSKERTPFYKAPFIKKDYLEDNNFPSLLKQDKEKSPQLTDHPSLLKKQSSSLDENDFPTLLKKTLKKSK